MITKTISYAALLAGAALILAGCAGGSGSQAGDARKPDAPAAGAATSAGEAKAQTTCPVMAGNPINKSIYSDYKGKRVYFCCGACPGMFAKDPEKYIKAMEDAGVKLEAAPAAADAPKP